MTKSYCDFCGKEYQPFQLHKMTVNACTQNAGLFGGAVLIAAVTQKDLCTTCGVSKGIFK